MSFAIAFCSGVGRINGGCSMVVSFRYYYYKSAQGNGGICRESLTGVGSDGVIETLLMFSRLI